MTQQKGRHIVLVASSTLLPTKQPLGKPQTGPRVLCLGLCDGALEASTADPSKEEGGPGAPAWNLYFADQQRRWLVSPANAT